MARLDYTLQSLAHLWPLMYGNGVPWAYSFLGPHGDYSILTSSISSSYAI